MDFGNNSLIKDISHTFKDGYIPYPRLCDFSNDLPENYDLFYDFDTSGSDNETKTEIKSPNDIIKDRESKKLKKKHTKTKQKISTQISDVLQENPSNNEENDVVKVTPPLVAPPPHPKPPSKSSHRSHVPRQQSAPKPVEQEETAPEIVIKPPSVSKEQRNGERKHKKRKHSKQAESAEEESKEVITKGTNMKAIGDINLEIEKIMQSLNLSNNKPSVKNVVKDEEEEEEEEEEDGNVAIHPDEEGEKATSEDFVTLTVLNVMKTFNKGTKFIFTVAMQPNIKKCERYQFIDFNTHQEVMYATKNSSFSQTGFNIFISNGSDKPIAKVCSNFVRSAYYTTEGTDDEKNEISAMKIKSSQNSVTHTQQLEAYIPAPGTTVKASGSQSVLAARKDSTVVEYVSKLPRMKNGIPVLYFGDRAKIQSVKNFILVQERQQSDEVLTFGKATLNSFAGKAAYPLTPLQAFSLCLTQFK